MSTHKHIDRICVAVLALCLLVTVLFMNGEALGLERLIDEDVETQSGSSAATFTANELNGDWDASDATVIRLTGTGASISGSGAYVYQGSVYIGAAGRYVLSGSLTDGSLIVDANNKAKIWILLDGVQLYRAGDACLRVNQAAKVFLTLAEGSENVLRSGASYTEAALSDGVKGAVFSRDKLCINGSGSLRIEGAFRHGIDANDDLAITGGSIEIRAARDAIHVNDGFRLCRARLTLTAGDEGIDVRGEDAPCWIESGSLSLVSEDDGVRAGGTVTLSGGSVEIRAKGDGVSTRGEIAITGGSLTIRECYEGLEAFAIRISGGDTVIYPEDDGLNAVGSAAEVGFGLGGGGALDASFLPEISLSGGSLTVINPDADTADAIDSNGNIRISGGSLLIALNGEGYALDAGSESGGTLTLSGGTLIGLGDFALAARLDSSQCVLRYRLSDEAAAGTPVALGDAEGTPLLSAAAPCAFDCLTFSSDALRVGERCRVSVGERAEELTLTSAFTTFLSAQSLPPADDGQGGGSESGFGFVVGGADEAPDIRYEEDEDFDDEPDEDGEAPAATPLPDAENAAGGNNAPPLVLSAVVLALGLGVAMSYRRTRCKRRSKRP